MKPGRLLAVVLGLATTVWMLWQVGPGTVLAQLGWRLSLLMLPQALVSVLYAGGWRYAFPRRLPALGPLIVFRLSGDAVNATTPTGTFGGDAVKAWLVGRGRGVRLAESLVSVVVAKTALLGAQVLFLALGLLLAVWAIGAPRSVMSLLGGLTLAGLLAVGGFLWAQQRGLFRTGSRALASFGGGRRAVWLTRRLDAGLRLYYRSRRGRFLVSAALHLLGWVAGALEVWLALVLLGSPLSFTTALVIEAGITGVRSASFLVPASIGIQEGGVVSLFVALGLGAGAGLTVGIIRRIREAVWVLAGYACLAVWRGARHETTPGRARLVAVAGLADREGPSCRPPGRR